MILDYPLLVWSQWRKNASISETQDLRGHYERLLDGKTLEQVPLKFALPVNCSANSILQANRDIGGIPTVPFDLRWYFFKMYEYLLNLQLRGVDTTQEIKELQVELLRQPEDIRSYFTKESLNIRFVTKFIVKKTFLRPSWAFKKFSVFC